MGQQKELVWVGVGSGSPRPAHWWSGKSRMFLVEGQHWREKVQSSLPGAPEGQSVGNPEKHSALVGDQVQSRRSPGAPGALCLPLQ